MALNVPCPTHHSGFAWATLSLPGMIFAPSAPSGGSPPRKPSPSFPEGYPPDIFHCTSDQLQPSWVIFTGLLKVPPKPTHLLEGYKVHKNRSLVFSSTLFFHGPTQCLAHGRSSLVQWVNYTKEETGSERSSELLRVTQLALWSACVRSS